MQTYYSYKKCTIYCYYAPQRGKHISVALSVCLAIRPEPCPANTLKLLLSFIGTWFIERCNWEGGQNLRTIIIIHCIFIELSPLTVFNNGCLSAPHLGKYKKDLNETWFIYRLQWAEWHTLRTIILPCIYIELSPLYIIFP